MLTARLGGWDGGWTVAELALSCDAAAPARDWICTLPEARHGASLFFTRPCSHVAASSLAGDVSWWW